MSIQRDVAFERELLFRSDIFDAQAYVAIAGEKSREDPIEHYLVTGWRLGLEPNGSFPGSLLQPYFAELSADEPPAITWLTLRAAGWNLPGTREELQSLTAGLRHTGLFDEAFYSSQLGSRAVGLDPAIHYVTLGERMGFAPSPEFDPEYYGARHLDVVQTGVNYLMHYAHSGRAEGRTPKEHPNQRRS